MSRILLTGGAGFIGGAVLTAALADGHEVRVLDSLRGDVHTGGDAAVDPRAELRTGDVRDAALVTDALTGVDVVLHQAAKVGLGVDFSDAPDYTSSNVQGTAVLLAAMAERGVNRLVLASSMVVYGEGMYERADVGGDGSAVGGSAVGGTPGSDGSAGSGSAAQVRPAPRREDDLVAGRFDPLDDAGHPLQPLLVREDDALDPRNVYALTKLAQEHLAASWARSTGGRAIALRYHNVYGPRMPRDTPYAGVASIFRSALARGDAPRVFEDGGQRRDFVHVRDVASANLAAVRGLDRLTDGGFRPYNIGSGHVHTILDLAAALHGAAPHAPAPVVTGEFRLGDVRHITASSERAAAELRWSAAIGFEEGIAEFATAPLRGSADAARTGAAGTGAPS